MKNLIGIISKLKRPYVILMVGAPLSGKSTIIKELLNKSSDDINVISRDEIVMDVFGDRDYNRAFKNVDQKLVDSILISKLLEYGQFDKNVIVDMTNMSRKRRMTNLSYFGENYYKIAIVFPFLSDDEYIKRNEVRYISDKKSISIDIIKKMINSYQPISESEGFDKVISYN